MASCPITSWHSDEEKQETVTDFPPLLPWASKSLWVMTVAMKLKGACSLEGKL